MTTLVTLVQDDVDQHGDNCACGKCNVNGKSYGVSIYPLELSVISDEPLERVYGPSEEAAHATAVHTCYLKGWKLLPVQGYIATVQVVIYAESQADACDWFSETLRGAEDLIDWSWYKTDRPLSPADQFGYCAPSLIDIPSDYSEGMSFEVLQENFVQSVETHIDAISELVKTCMLDAGDTMETSQKLCIIQALNTLQATINGVEPGDLK